MSKPTPAGYRPSGSQCAQCQHAAEDCSGIDFAQMAQVGKIDKDRVQRVACPFYVRANVKRFAPCGRAAGTCGQATQTCGRNGCWAEVVPPIEPAHPNVTGHAYAGAVLLNLLGADRRPCRCGPDGCADSVACPRGER